MTTLNLTEGSWKRNVKPRRVDTLRPIKPPPPGCPKT